MPDTAGKITNRETGQWLTLTAFKPGRTGQLEFADVRVLGASNAMWVRLDEWDYEEEES